MEPSSTIPRQTVLPGEKVTTQNLRDEIGAIVLRFPAKVIGEAAGRTPEAAKKWRAGYACPDLASALNLARAIPAVKYLLYREIERGAPEGVNSPRLLVEALLLLERIASSEGEHASKARAILSGHFDAKG